MVSGHDPENSLRGAGGLLASLHVLRVPCGIFLQDRKLCGEVRVCGGTDLKSSQNYSSVFGRSVAELMVAREAWVVLFQLMAMLPLCVAVFWKDEVRNEMEERRIGLRYRVANENIWACCARQKLLESKTKREMKDLGTGWAGWDGYGLGLPWRFHQGVLVTFKEALRPLFSIIIVLSVAVCWDFFGSH